MTSDTTNHEKPWVVSGIAEGGRRTVPRIVLPDKPTGRRWRITYEEMTE